MTLKILHKRSATDGDIPSPSELEYGEIGVNYNRNQPGLFIKDDANQIRRVGGPPATTVIYFQPVTINETPPYVRDPFEAPWAEDVITTNIPIPTGATGFTLITLGQEPVSFLEIQLLSRTRLSIIRRIGVVTLVSMFA